MAMIRTSFLFLLLAILAGQAAVAQEELNPNREVKKYRDPSTTMSEPIYRRLTTIHDNLGEEDYAKALESLRRFKNTAMNDYEEAMVMQTYGFAYLQQGDYGQAIDYFEKSLAMESLPGAAQQGMLYSLASLYASEGRFQTAIDTMRRWFQYEEKPVADAYMLIATSFVEMDRFKDALPYVEKAIELADKPREEWYGLKLAIYFQEREFARAVPVLKEVLRIWPDQGKYWDMLASAHLELRQDKDALDAMMIAYANGLIDDQSRLMAVVQLNMAENIPYTAGLILEREIAAGRIEGTKKNLEILLQAWLSSKEYDRAVQVIDRLGPLADDGEYFMRKAGIHNELGEWEKVAFVETLKTAVKQEAFTMGD